MSTKQLPAQLRVRREFLLRLVAFGVAANGLIIIGSTLLGELAVFRGRLHINDVAVGLPLVIGLTLLYLSALLARRKRAAWAVVMPLYGFILGLNVTRLILLADRHDLMTASLLTNFVLPALVVFGLVLERAAFTVKSDIRSFTLSLRFIGLILLVGLLYGVIGFQLLDRRDFHQEINLGQAIHRTIDQFDLTTNRPLVPYTRRARLFLDSLSIISIGAVGYGLVSLFQPLRARLSDQASNRTLMRELLESYPAGSEDFFKLWPHDKYYFMNEVWTAGLAYRVSRGVALVVGDPAGDSKTFPRLLKKFEEFCRLNDWLPAFVYAIPAYNELYRSHGLSLQKIGETATIDIKQFKKQDAGEGYFKNLHTEFTKAGYSAELLQPPHDNALLARLKVVSDDWLAQPGRTERGFMSSPFSFAYLRQCPVMVLRGNAGRIQAFLSQIPSFDKAEVCFDLLRFTADSPTGSDDFLLMQYIDTLTGQAIARLNLGFCPLADMSGKDEKTTIIDNAMRFIYASGDRFHSFNDLYTAKNKFEPQWQDRMVAYRGGLRGFTRTLTALNRVTKRRITIR